jgi:hypothetical protein
VHYEDYIDEIILNSCLLKVVCLQEVEESELDPIFNRRLEEMGTYLIPRLLKIKFKKRRFTR